MDYEEFKSLTDKEMSNFLEWYKKSPKMSMDELLKSYDGWLTKTADAYEKYGATQGIYNPRDVSTVSSKMLYLMLLTACTWKSLEAYTAKLQEEYKKLKKKPVRRTKKRR